MNFAIPDNTAGKICTGVCVAAALASGVAIISQNLQRAANEKAREAEISTAQKTSQQLNNDRARALEIVAKDLDVRRCWIADGLFTIDRVAPTTENGSRIPSSCFRSRDGAQFSYVAEYGGAVRMQFIFTQTEVQRALSRLKK